MSLALPERPAGRPDSKDAFGRTIARIVRLSLVGLGIVLVVVGIVISPLPGPVGLPVVAIGLILILRNSYKARRAFIRAHRNHPRFIRPLRRLLRTRIDVIGFLRRRFGAVKSA